MRPCFVASLSPVTNYQNCNIFCPIIWGLDRPTSISRLVDFEHLAINGTFGFYTHVGSWLKHETLIFIQFGQVNALIPQLVSSVYDTVYQSVTYYRAYSFCHIVCSSGRPKLSFPGCQCVVWYTNRSVSRELFRARCPVVVVVNKCLPYKQ